MILIVDGLNLFIRNFCVGSKMDSNGEPIGGVGGSLRSLKCLLRDSKAPVDRVVFVWDGRGGSTRRRGVYKEYKAGRKPRLNRVNGELEDVDESRRNLREQYTKLRGILALLGVHQVDVEGLEADDAIAYLATHVVTSEVTVVTTDKDMLQLVSERVSVLSPTKGETYTSKNFVELTGFLPENYVYARALCGDRSDNIVGIPGIGMKTVLKLLPALGTTPVCSLAEMKDLIEAVPQKNPKRRALVEGWEVIKGNVALMQLSTPNMDAGSALRIRESIEPQRASYHASALRIALAQHGIDELDHDFMSVFQSFNARRTHG